MSALVINTLTEDSPEVIKAINTISYKLKKYRIINTCDKSISNCTGCYHCLLVEPGICKLQDDFEEILKLFMEYDNIIFICNTSFGIVDFKAKQLLERFFPIITFFSTYREGEIRNIPRYKKEYSFGIVYEGAADREYMNYWFERASSQFGAGCLGAYPISEVEELIKCIL